MQNLVLYSKYAWRSIQRGGQRSFFAILCIAVGVASIVALQATGLTVQDSVAGDARASSQSDVLVNSRQGFFSQDDLKKMDALKQNNTIVDYVTMVNYTSLTVNKADGSKSNNFGSNYPSFVTDPTKYPFYGTVETVQPLNKSLRDVLTGPNQIVLDSKMANSVEAKVGDTIKVTGNGKQGQLKVVGILSSKTLTPATDTGQAGFTGYGYISYQTAQSLFNAADLQPQSLYVKTTSTTTADNKARDAINAISPVFNAATSNERNDQLKQATKGFSDILSYVGLLSLLIGSVGVVNTMLVVVGRRSTEIATIKALGMESGQTVLVFVIESAILGLVGSVVGVILGEFLSVIVNNVAGSFLSTDLNYKLYPQPIIMGLVVGVVTAIVFGLLPAYSASKIPPAQVLRQKVNALPRISILATLGIIVVMTVIMGILAGVVLDGQFGLGIGVAFATLVSCSILVLIFSGILWLVGKIPLPFGLNYKMARRNLSRSRVKSATTMLVMLVGIFAMAVVFIMASSLKDTIQTALAKSFGYNLAVSTISDQQATAVQQTLDSKQVPGLQKYLPNNTVQLQLVSAGGQTTGQLIARKIAYDKAHSSGNSGGYGSGFEISGLNGIRASDLNAIGKLTTGRLFNNNQEMLINQSLSDEYGLKIGDQLVFQDFSGGKHQLTIVGIYKDTSFIVNLPVATSLEAVEAIPNHSTRFELTTDDNQVNAAEQYLQNKFPTASVTDLSFIANIFNTIINNITAFPVLLAILCLIAGAVLIANNVALAVLERRTEMGVMKSIGADSGRVLSILNWETSIVGFLGGVIGLFLAVTVAAIGVSTLGTADNPAVLSVSPFISLGMIVLAVVLALAATIASAWGAVQEKPLVVLRYE